MFKPVPTKVDFPAQEHAILKFWAQNKTFEKLVAKNRGKPRWSFVDGPITANNPMGVHHAWGRTYKDLYQAYKAMRGYDQRYQNGFDCQGLWVEVEVEKELGFTSKRDIEAFGMDQFVKLCKARVLKYAGRQTDQSIRLGYWDDWNDPAELERLSQLMIEDPRQVITLQGPNGPVTGPVETLVAQLGGPELGGSYFTFSDENNYTIWHFLKTCHQKGLLYRGYDSMTWCPRCGTGISHMEIVGEGYKERSDPSVYLIYRLRNRPGESLLVWTTTPWTLSSNVATAVHPDLPYVLVAHKGEKVWLSKGAVKHALRGEYTVLDEKVGTELVGWTYDGAFDELPGAAAAVAVHRVIPWKDVGEEEGTGIVHIAPGCGAEDYQLGLQFGLPAIGPIDEFGNFVEGFGFLTGKFAHDVAEPVYQSLREKGLLYRTEKYTHRYPHCWRCDTPLVFRLVDEWYVSMKKLRYDIMEVTKQITWIPAFGLERELDWLRNMGDWMISKKRYWGLALPIYWCDHCQSYEVIGSKEELKARAVAGWEQFEGHTPHRPWVDYVKIACSGCGATLSRIPDVGNPWLDAGIVPFSTLGYHTRPDFWRQWFPADFISESFPGQFRNWFYSLLVQSTVLEKKPPFLTVFSYALLRDEKGEEMHKSKGNAIWFDEAAEIMGADVMRWMFCLAVPENNLNFGYGLGDETRRRFFIPLWNVYSFFVTYANLDQWTPALIPGPPALGTLDGSPSGRGGGEMRTALDCWILSELHTLVGDVTAALDRYDARAGAMAIEAFVENLSDWYVRRSRRRFWKSESDADKVAAYSTLYECLVTLCKLLAPYIPFLAEAMYQNLVRSVDANAPESVRLCDWPTPDAAKIDQALMAETRLVQKVVSLGRAARQKANLRVRQPLSQMQVRLRTPAEAEAILRLSDQVLDELNIKELTLAKEDTALVRYAVKPAFSKLGPKYGRKVPVIQKALAGADPREVARSVKAGQPVVIDTAEETFILEPGEIEVTTTEEAGFSVMEEGGYLVAVSTTLTPELIQEGLAREVIRHVQEMRKSAGFEISDRIVVNYQAGPTVSAAISKHAAVIQQETLANRLVNAPGEGAGESEEMEGEKVTLWVRRD